MMDTRPITTPPDPNPRKPTLRLPQGAWDCHIHVYGPSHSYPFDPLCPYLSGEDLPETYMQMNRHLGLSRAVLVNGAGYGTDTRYQEETLERYPDFFRGVSYVKDTISPSELTKLDRLGVRAARFVGGPTAWSHLPRLEPAIAKKITDFGWHLEFLTFSRGGMAAEKDRFLAMPYTIVLDHFGTLDAAAGLDAPGFTAILELLDTGRVWVKLSNPAIATSEPFPYPTMTKFARALVAHAPERLVWATNWPHVVTTPEAMPNDGDLVDLLAEWIPDQRQRQLILVDNPNTLYGR